MYIYIYCIYTVYIYIYTVYIYIHTYDISVLDQFKKSPNSHHGLYYVIMVILYFTNSE